jgi:hypothetical protein
MIPTYNDFKILFDGKPEKYLELYRDEIDEILAPDEDDDTSEAEDFGDVETLDAEELFELLFTIQVIAYDDYCEVINTLSDEYLPYDVDSDYEDDELVVYIDDDRHIIDDTLDGYPIIRQFDEIIRPDFETRVLKMSVDEDNIHSLIILKSDFWKKLEAEYGTKVAAYFATIDEIDFN